MYFNDHRYASSSGQSPRKSSQKLEMLLGQEQDGKPFLNFGKKSRRKSVKFRGRGKGVEEE